MKLREYQQLGIQLIKQAMIDSRREGKPRNTLLAAPCAYGKTITAAYLLKAYQDAGKRGIFICDRVKLVNQSIAAFGKLGLNFGVIQSFHELYDAKKPIQIASAQSLENMREWPHADFVIVDECHSLRKSIRDKMAAWTGVPFLGLSATPYSKGLGNYFSKLVVPIEPRQLLEQGYLCPVDYYGGRKASLKGVKTKKLSTGGSDYLDSSLKEAIENDKKLAGDIVKNWIKRANGRMTIAFSPSVKHSKHLVDLFNDAGIPAVHIDYKMSYEERNDIYEGHRQGDFLILSCSRLLNTGYDEPKVSCLIDCYPTKSIIQYVQRQGRAARAHTPLDATYKKYLEKRSEIVGHQMLDIYFVVKKTSDIKIVERQLLEKDFFGDKVYVVDSCSLRDSDKILIFRDVEPNKENAIYLDHAGNVSRHGFAEDIVPEELDDETKEYNERKLTKDKKEPNIKQCPQCYQEMAGIRCNKCGYEVPIKEQIETDNQELEQLLSVDAKAWHKKTTREDREKFYGMLKYYERQKGYKAGWAAHKFRERSGVWPNSYKSAPPQAPDKEFMGYIKHLAIKRRYAA